MKKIFFLSIFVLALGFATHVFAAQEFVPLAGIPGLTDVSADSAGLASFFNNLYKYLIGIAAALAVIEIIWGGLEISTQDSVSKQSDGKKRIQQAIFGLVLVLSPVLVFSIINPSILNLSLDLPPLDTKTPTAWSGTGTITTTTDIATGCAVSGTIGILQIANCPSKAAADAWGKNCTIGLLSVDPLTTATNGTGLYVASCQGTQVYTFINPTGTFDPKSTINQLQPIADNPSNPNNATSAINFANICKSASPGWKICINGVNWFSDTVTCPPTTTQIPASVKPKCYQKSLVCSGGSSFFLKTNTCDTNPGWTPFQ